jgi:hypothetical protein
MEIAEPEKHLFNSTINGSKRQGIPLSRMIQILQKQEGAVFVQKDSGGIRGTRSIQL